MLMTVLTADEVAAEAAARLDTTAIAALVAFFVPLLVAAITKRTASDLVKSAVNIVSVAIVAVIALVLSPGDGPLSWQMIVNTFITALVAALVAYKGVWKPLGATAAVGSTTAGFGLGSPVAVGGEVPPNEAAPEAPVKEEEAPQ